MLGGANVITKAGDGTILALLFGGLNVVTQVGNGSMYLLMHHSRQSYAVADFSKDIGCPAYH
jgi:hypothetical protein